jgi:hypothetical protein
VIKEITVGAGYDYFPDGNFIMTANEGEPNDTYSIDPDGSVLLLRLMLIMHDFKFRKF